MEYWDGQMDLFDANPQREVSRDQNVVVFDLETQRSFAEVGGRSQMHKLGVSVGVAYRYDEDRFLVVTEDAIDELIGWLYMVGGALSNLGGGSIFFSHFSPCSCAVPTATLPTNPASSSAF